MAKDSSTGMLYNILRLILVLILKVVFRLKVFGKEYIPKKGGFILASNHHSYLDPIVLGVASPRRLNYMARHDLFANPFFSWLITTCGAFPVKRNSPDLSALKEAMSRLKGGKVLALFPEGTRGFEGGSLQPQSGIGFLAAKLDVPVIPAFIRGTEKALPKGAKFIQPEKISVYFGKPRNFHCEEVLRRDRKVWGKQISIERRLPYQDIALRIMEEIRRLA